MKLPDINLDSLGSKITELEQRLMKLDAGLDYREKFLIELQLSFYYRMVMFEAGRPSGYVRQSSMNRENFILNNHE